MEGGEDGNADLKSDAALRPGGDLAGLYAAMIASSDDAVVGLAPDGTIVSWNPASEALFGFSEAEAVGSPVHMTAGEEHRAELDHLLARIARGEHVRHYETERVRKNGERVPVSITLSPIYGPDGAVVGASKITRDVTERRLADIRTKEALDYAEGIVETVRMPLVVLDSGLSVQRANGAFYREFDVTPDKVLGRRIYDLGNRQWDIPDLRRLLEEILPNERTLDDYKVEHDFERLGRREMRLNARRMEQRGGAAGLILLSIEDVTEQRAAETRVRFQSHLLEAVGQAVIASDPAGRVLYWNKAAEELYGWSKAEVEGRNVADLVVAPEAAAEAQTIMERLRVGESWSGEFAVRHRDGSVFTAYVTDAPIMDGDGRLEAIVGISADLTDRKRTEAALRESEQRTRTILESVTDAFYAVDKQWRFTYLNHEAERLLGRTRGDLVGKHIWEEFTPAVETAFYDAYHRAMAGTETVRFEVLYPPHEKWYEVHAYPSSDGIAVYFRDVTERKQLDQALRESEARLQRLFEANVVGVGVSDAAGNWVEANDELLRMLGYDRAELRAGEARWKDMTPDRYLPVDEQAIAEAVQRGACTPYEKEYIRKDGTLLPVLLGYATLDEPDRFVCFVLDLTRMRKVSEALKQSEERLRGLMDQAPFSIQILSADGRTVRVNRAWEELWGLTLDQVADYNVLDDPQLEAKGVATALRKAFGGEPAELPEIAYDPNESLPGRTRHDEPVRWISAVAYPIKDAAGVVREVALVHEDITARRKAEAGLRESEERFRAIVEHSVAGVAEADLSGRFTFLNDRYCEIIGRSRMDLLAGLRMQDVTHPADLPHNLWAFERLVRDGTPFQIEKRYVQPDGRIVWVGNSVSGVRDAGGRVKSVVAVSVDVTDRKRAESDTRFLADASAALADLSDPASTLTTVAGMAVPHFADWCAIDLLEDGVVRQVAVAHADPAKAALARDLHRLMPQELDASSSPGRILNTAESELVPEVTDELLEALVPDRALSGLLQKLGLRSYLRVPLKTRGRVQGALTFAAARSGRVYDERDLAVAEDLARRAAVALENARLYAEVRDAARRKDEFLAMLAHELRNPLAPIRSGLDLLKLSGAEPEVVDVMSDQVGHVVRLVDDLLDVSRILRGKVELKKEPTDLATVLRRATEAVRPRAEEHAQQLIAVLPDGPLRIDADPVRLTQVVTNLLNNASKYTDDGGRIRLEAGREGGEAVIRVSDTGIGIDASLLPRVFELFTQADQALDRSQGGLGIGLTVVKSLVEMHGGSVTASSEGHGRGSEFVIRLPAAEPAEQAVRDEPGAAPAGPLRILVVDDNAPAAKLLGRLLEKLGGHTIRIAHDGDAALAEAEVFQPDLVLLDIGLPRMNGFEVARRLRERPGFGAVLLVALTGYGTAEDRRRSLEAGFDEHLVKPPGVDMLRTVLAHPKLRS